MAKLPRAVSVQNFRTPRQAALGQKSNFGPFICLQPTRGRSTATGLLLDSRGSVSAEPPYSAQIITGHFLAILPPFQSAFN